MFSMNDVMIFVIAMIIMIILWHRPEHVCCCIVFCIVFCIIRCIVLCIICCTCAMCFVVSCYARGSGALADDSHRAAAPAAAPAEAAGGLCNN